jgi:ribokinase
MPAVTVVGSVNLDLVIRVASLPAPGETVTDGEFGRHPGGKGANQALAARRLGAEVELVAAVGEDGFASEALALLHQAGVGLARCWLYEEVPTGVALIMVDGGGENAIAVAPGANRLLTPDTLELNPAEAVLCQLEIPVETVTAAAAMAEGFFALNAAPARPVATEVFRRADLVVVNEIEHATYGDDLLECRGLVAVTQGAAGAVIYRHGRQVARASPPRVKVVDTVGAGDAFVGAMVVSLLEGRPVQVSLERACAAGALAATRPGAQTSLPTAAEIDAIMEP